MKITEEMRGVFEDTDDTDVCIRGIINASGLPARVKELEAMVERYDGLQATHAQELAATAHVRAERDALIPLAKLGSDLLASGMVTYDRMNPLYARAVALGLITVIGVETPTTIAARVLLADMGAKGA